ncbi:hypothetical protein GCM10011494_24720 [Novosphingobium endophyticum]|uniref:Uncharacterized protein n=1 Tax=Novosphingobium endophyticum TaxID=1955250 RepID=A0A916X4X8_9SPHN|nr:hypothetical protein GCM10011494_24720 [Novosphingobium endophyticum]
MMQPLAPGEHAAGYEQQDEGKAVQREGHAREKSCPGVSFHSGKIKRAEDRKAGR